MLEGRAETRGCEAGGAAAWAAPPPVAFLGGSSPQARPCVRLGLELRGPEVPLRGAIRMVPVPLAVGIRCLPPHTGQVV